MFVYYPTRELSGDPSRVGLSFRDVFVTSEDGVKLHGWFVPCPGADITLLILHGNAGNIGHRLPWLEILHELGVNIWIIDYRGYGRSEGKPFEKGLYRDAMAAYLWWAHEQGASGKKLVLLGESLGGAVAVNLAASVPVAGIILQSTFTSARDVAKTVFPLGLLRPLVGVRFDSESNIARIHCPKLIIHGDRDEIVPYNLGRKLFEAATEPKQFYQVVGAGHNDLIWAAGPEYAKRIADFLATLEQKAAN
jgi:fermentation-respiration switch protein FrsA (DUF1100 family)